MILSVLTNSDVQAWLSVGITLAGLLLLLIARDMVKFDRYGREALVAGGVFMMVTGVMRLASYLDLIDGSLARGIIGLTGWAIVIVIVQTVYLGWRKRNGGHA